MTRRLVAVLVPAPSAAGDGFPDERLRLAMVEDVYETVAGLELVEAVLVVWADDPAGPALQELTWPGTEVLRLAGGSLADRAREVLDVLGRLGADEATVVAGDAPDLPGLLVGKLHRGLGSAEVAVLPADGGGLVALAARTPLPDWTIAAGLDLDAPDGLASLRALAPARTAVSVGPGWHRVRTSADLDRLDPGLEGWDATRAALSRSR